MSRGGGEKSEKNSDCRSRGTNPKKKSVDLNPTHEMRKRRRKRKNGWGSGTRKFGKEKWSYHYLNLFKFRYPKKKNRG